MKKSALIKDILRDIAKSKGRFFSIVVIIALGVSFFFGLKMAPESMWLTADKYYDDYNLMDIRLVSTLGLTRDDVDAVQEIKGVKEVFPTYTMDVLAEYEENESVLKVHGYLEDTNVNNYRLIEGRMPEKANEAVLEKGKNGALEVPIGSKIKLTSGKDDPLSDDLRNTEYEIVGLVQTPYYLSFEKGNSNIGNGKVRNFLVIPQENFKSDIYTDIFLTVDGARELHSYKDEYFDFIDPVISNLEDLAKDRENIRYKDIFQEGREEIEEGKKKYLKEKEKAEKELNDVLEDLEDGRQEIIDGEKDLEKEEEDLNRSIQEGKEEISRVEIDLVKAEEELEKGLRELNEEKNIAKDKFAEAEKEIRAGEDSLTQVEDQIKSMKAMLENSDLSQEEREGVRRELEPLEAMFVSVQKEVERGRAELISSKAELERGEEELQKNKKGLDKARLELERERERLRQGERIGRRKLQDGKNEIAKAKAELEDGEREYKDAKEKMEKELAEALEELEEGERELERLEEGKWYVLDRDKHYSYVDYDGAADRIDALAKVFPVFFAMVAALVCLTGMTRMVDEQRINIGTLKALGYGRVHIAVKYIFYAFTATVIGSIIGIAIGYVLFPTVIFNAYGIMYILPDITLAFDNILALSITLGAVLLITGTTFIAISNELRETPAILMRPKAPKIGKRILLERIPIIWNRFNFSYKVTLRNIFRYKRRFLMTVFGIAGCTALMLTAFGIRDSIRTVVDRQYGSIFNYDISIGLDEEGIAHIDRNEKIESYQLILKESGELSKNDLDKEVSIVVPKDIKEIERYISLQDRKTGESVKIKDEGVVITEQISKEYSLNVGDKILLRNGDDNESNIQITDIVENYTFNYVYMSPEYYEKVFLKNVSYNEAVGMLNNTPVSLEDDLVKELIENKGINYVEQNSALRKEFEDTISSIIYVVLVMIASAGSLAFVVLYNLTNVNISERIREIATIKVLGFYDGEVSAYIYRENTILTFIGIFVGFIIGKYLHRYIMLTVEMDNIMFGLKLDFKSYLIAGVLTIVFATLVNIAMHYKLKGIEMVESLKSVDW